MSSDSPRDEELQPEDILQGLKRNSREIYSHDEIAEFLKEWSENKSFVEDLEYVSKLDIADEVNPEEVFEYLASSQREYSIDEMIKVAESWSDNDWERHPEISGTGEISRVSLGDKVTVPRQTDFIPLSGGGYKAETNFEDENKDVWLQEHNDSCYQTEAKPLSSEEVMDIFSSLESLAPAICLHEVNYDGVIYFLDSEDIEYFFEFRNQIDNFDGELYRIDSYFGDFNFEVSRLPGEDEQYRVMLFSREGEEYPLESYAEVLDNNLVKGMKTRLQI